MKNFFIVSFNFLFLLCISVQGFSRGIEFSKEPLIPPRIIRVCCAFGSNVGVMGVPFFRLTEITGVEDIGPHHYLGNRSEGNGIIYTRRGGFIDLGHLRDQADWTAYLYEVIRTNKGNPGFELKLGYEGGTKKLVLNIPDNLSETNSMILAGRIAYDLSVWHEIATWFGVSSIPFVPERYSSFSIEDNYSNLLGATLGIESLESDLPFCDAMTKLLNEKLIELGRVDSVSQTYDAMEKVLNKWWTRKYQFPQANVTLKRAFSTYADTYPLIVPEMADTTGQVCVLELPQLCNTDLNLSDLYTLYFRLNGKFMSKHFFVHSKKKVITNHDFLSLINEIAIESDKKLARARKVYRN